jgi:hypothetical protein
VAGAVQGAQSNRCERSSLEEYSILEVRAWVHLGKSNNLTFIAMGFQRELDSAAASELLHILNIQSPRKSFGVAKTGEPDNTSKGTVPVPNLGAIELAAPFS